MVTHKDLKKKFLKATKLLEEYDGSEAERITSGLVKQLAELTTAYKISEEDLQLKRALGSENERQGYDKKLSDLEVKLEADRAAAHVLWTNEAKDAIRERRKKS